MVGFGDAVLEKERERERERKREREVVVACPRGPIRGSSEGL